MKTDIFIRSYLGDFEWLKYCLRSLAKYASGFNEIILCVPQRDHEILKSWNLSRERVISCSNYSNDYLGQQVTKLTAFKYSDADRILFIDSDVIILKPITPDTFMLGKKIQMYKTKYDREKLGDACCWQRITKNAIGFEPEFEYMRRLPLMYWRETLVKVYEFMEKRGLPVEAHVMAQPNKEFSEFNLLGAFADAFEKDKYEIQDTDITPISPPVLKQYWSWGGLSDAIKTEIETLLA